MSKLNNLIGFWNNKSLEEGDNNNKTQHHVTKVRPKSENLDHNFSQRMEFFASPKNLRGDEMKVKFLRDNEPKSHQEPVIKKSVGFGQESASVANGRDIKESDHQSDPSDSERSDAPGVSVSVVVTDTDDHHMMHVDIDARYATFHVRYLVKCVTMFCHPSVIFSDPVTHDKCHLPLSRLLSPPSGQDMIFLSAAIMVKFFSNS